MSIGSNRAEALIKRLGLQPHPEGGWYRETWRASSEGQERAAGTAVLYVLDGDHRSQWNRHDATEIWLWHGGDPLLLQLAASHDGPIEERVLGPDVDSGQSPQVVVQAGHWQAAKPIETGSHGFTFLSCVVAPAFEFSSYELALEGWRPGR